MLPIPTISMRTWGSAVCCWAPLDTVHFYQGLKIPTAFCIWGHTEGALHYEFFHWVSSSELQGMGKFFTVMSEHSAPIIRNQDTWKHLSGIPSCSVLILGILCLCWLPSQLRYGTVSSSLPTPFLPVLNLEMEKGSLSRSCAQLISFEHHS